MMDQATTGITLNQQSIDVLHHMSNSGLCVIPAAIINVMLENTKLLAKSIEMTQSIAKSLIAMDSKPASDAITDISNADILSRLENLTAKVNSITSFHEGEGKVEAVWKDLKIRSTLFQKQLHAEKISNMYDDYLSNDVPFAPRKFRVKVSAFAKDNEKMHQRDKTIFAVQTQIKIMRGNISEWKDRISKLDLKRETFLSDYPDRREIFEKRIIRDEEKSMKSVDRAVFKLQRSYESEKQAFPSADFLLSTQKQRAQRHTHNVKQAMQSWADSGGQWPPPPCLQV